MTTMYSSLETIQSAFMMQSETCQQLESPFMARLMLLFATRRVSDGAVAERLYQWPGRTGFMGDLVPLRIAGALHSLVLGQKCDALQSIYPPRHCTDDVLWTAVDAALQTHAEMSLQWLQSPPQTNEVRRSAVIYAGLSCIAELVLLPLELYEVGASAGLNLLADHYAITLDRTTCGDSASAVVINPEWQGRPAPEVVPEIVSVQGCDLNPLDVRVAADRLRLLSYIWADQSERLARTEAAIEQARKSTVNVVQMSAVDWLGLPQLQPVRDRTKVIFHTIVWQYLSAAEQLQAQTALSRAGAMATLQSPVAWLRLEADAGGQAGAAILLTLWPVGNTQCIGRADFHGRWINWTGWTP